MKNPAEAGFFVVRTPFGSKCPPKHVDLGRNKKH
jgi:hypothetical protein